MSERPKRALPSPGLDGAGAQPFSEPAAVQNKSAGPPMSAGSSILQGMSQPQPAATREAYRTLLLLCSCATVWLCCSYIDATYTPRDLSYVPSKSLIISYQWCMVGYASNLILTLMKWESF